MKTNLFDVPITEDATTCRCICVLAVDKLEGQIRNKIPNFYETGVIATAERQFILQPSFS